MKSLATLRETRQENQTLPISEIFHSLQGEGPNAGDPATFLRLAFCNLKCTWCDSKYTWDWERFNPESEVQRLSLTEVEREIEGWGCSHIVVTGGEPLLQQTALVPLLSRLDDSGYFIEVETNGTIVPSSPLLDTVDQWNVSPKLSNSGNAGTSRDKPDAIRIFRRSERAYFKFVMARPYDIEEVKAFREEYGVERERIVLMPEARTPRDLGERGVWVAELCRKYGFLFTTRLQIQLWEGRRGF
ncbi:MAG: 7-carboxy-7-deazaguanine synthase QueE [Thermoplasmata archaeon]